MSPTTHELKSRPEFYWPMQAGVKRFELRFNDRNFQVNDNLRIREWWPNGSTEGHYSGSETLARITWILHQHVGLHPDFVVLGIAVVVVEPLRHG